MELVQDNDNVKVADVNQEVKIDEQELNQIKEGQALRQQIYLALGQLFVQDKANKATQDSLLSQLEGTNKKENELVKEISEKYGDGAVDLNTGVITKA